MTRHKDRRAPLAFGTALAILALVSPLFQSCSPDSEEEKAANEYKEWKARNEAFFQTELNATDSQGSALYQRVSPSWAPGTTILLQWIEKADDPKGNQLRPLDNSTVTCAYELHDIDGKLIDSGAAFKTQPVNTVPGFWTALTSMQVGDSLKAVVPMEAGYGYLSNGKVRPFSTLLFSIRLKSIEGYEIKP